MNICELSTEYSVRKLTAADIDIIYELSAENTMFYKYCPPYVTRDSILSDMSALPPETSSNDKYYIGFFDGDNLIGIMDLIFNYPNKNTAFIGLFMMKKSMQGKGTGSKIIDECCKLIKSEGYTFVRLGYAKGNPQSEAFWTKNGFEKTGEEHDNINYTAVLMQKAL